MKAKPREPRMDPLTIEGAGLTADDGLDGDICIEIEIDACGPDARAYLNRQQCHDLIAWMQEFLHG